MTRIIGGTAGGRRLETPRGQTTRPTSDRVREALFSADRGLVRLARRAALPRPVRRLRRRRPGGLVARRGRGDVGRAGPAYGRPDRPQRRDPRLRPGRGGRLRSRRPASPPAAPYDVVFLDPPYPLSDDEVDADLAALVDHGWLVPGALVVVERSARGPGLRWPAGLVEEPSKEVRRDRCFGTVTPPAPATPGQE